MTGNLGPREPAVICRSWRTYEDAPARRAEYLRLLQLLP